MGQYRLEFWNHSERPVEIVLVDDRGEKGIDSLSGDRASLQAVVQPGRRITDALVLPSNRSYFLHVTPLDGRTATKVVPVQTGPCCPQVVRTLTYAVDAGDFPALESAASPADSGSEPDAANHPFLGDWVCGPGTMKITAEGGSIAGEGSQGWGPRLRDGGTITGFKIAGDTATMKVAYGDKTSGTFEFLKLSPDRKAFEVHWT